MKAIHNTAFGLALILALTVLPGCGGDEEASGGGAGEAAGGGAGGSVAPSSVVDPVTEQESTANLTESGTPVDEVEAERAPGSDPAGSQWRVGELTITLNQNRTIGSGHEEGGRWREVRPGYVELIGAGGDKFIDLTLSTDGQTGHAFWTDGSMQLAHRIR